MQRSSENLFVTVSGSTRGYTTVHTLEESTAQKNSEKRGGEKKLDLTQLAHTISSLYNFPRSKVVINIQVESFSRKPQGFISKNKLFKDEENNVSVRFKNVTQISGNLIAMYLAHQIESPKGLRDSVFKRGFSKRSLNWLCAKVLEKSPSLAGLRVELHGR